MEELLYWGAILGFYLWSAYKSNQKKAKRLIPKESPIEKKVEEPPQLPNNQKINILDFLNEAFEESSSLKNKTKESVPSIQDHVVKENFLDHFNSDHDLSNVDDRDLDRLSIKEQHLDEFESQLKHKEIDLNQHNQTLISVQKKYRANPTKLGIIMQAIFEPPKAMQ